MEKNLKICATRWRLAVVGCITLFVAASTFAADLRGTILNRQGEPIPNALVFIYTAKQRTGPSTLCPSCYRECGLRARTDDEGNFRIPGVSIELLYRLVVLAKGYRPDYITNADPIGPSAEIKLRPLKISEVPPENRIVGKLINRSGKPVTGATIDVEGVRYGQYSFSSAIGGRVDPLAVTDENGEFFFNCSNGLAAITVTLDGPGIAKRRMWLDVGKTHLIRVDEGATVTGRLVHEGAPLRGATVAMVTQERESSVFMRGFEVATDTQGRFSLQFIPGDNRFFLYAKMKDMRDFGVALPLQSVNTGRPGSRVDLGEVKVVPAHVIRGRVVFTDGAMLPPRTRIHFSRDSAWDFEDVRLNEDGTFEFAGVPAESVSLSVRVPGYRISARNPNKDWLNEGRIVGRVEKSIEDFVIELEPGPQFERESIPPGTDQQPREKPLRGAPVQTAAK